VRISAARVLTSDKCVAILKEREKKQKQQQQEKERNRLEREQKKKEKEEEQKKKKALAAERKALAAAKKAEKEARKARVTNNLVSDSSTGNSKAVAINLQQKKSQRFSNQRFEFPKDCLERWSR